MGRTRSGLYVPLAAGFFNDAKVLEAGEAAGWLYLNMLAAAKLNDNDGVFTARQISRLGVSGWEKRLSALVEVGLVAQLERHPDIKQISLDVQHYGVVGWLNWNDSRAEREAKLAEDRRRKAEKAAKEQGNVTRLHA